MQVKISLDHIITKEDFLDIYRIFCESYKINDKENKIILQYNRLNHFQDLINYKPEDGAKFFGSNLGRKIYEFHGYNDNREEERERDFSDFKSRMAELFEVVH